MILCSLVGLGAVAAFGAGPSLGTGALYGALAGSLVAPFVPLPRREQ